MRKSLLDDVFCYVGFIELIKWCLLFLLPLNCRHQKWKRLWRATIKWLQFFWSLNLFIIEPGAGLLTRLEMLCVLLYLSGTQKPRWIWFIFCITVSLYSITCTTLIISRIVKHSIKINLIWFEKWTTQIGFLFSFCVYVWYRLHLVSSS